MTADPKRRAVLALLRAGLRPIPVWWPLPNGRCACTKTDCNASGKHPIGSWAEYQQRPPRPSELHDWLDQYPDANWGVVLGEDAGVIAADLDGREAEHLLLERGIELPESATALSARGAKVLLKHPGGQLQRKIALVKGNGSAVDLLADGSQVVVPPSRHYTGTSYKWIIPLSAGIAVAPPALVELARASTRDVGDTRQTTEPKGRIPKGQRNTALTSLAGTLRRKGLEQPEIITALLGVNGRRCDPPLAEQEIRIIAASICRYPPGTGDEQPWTADAEPDPTPFTRPLSALLSLPDEPIPWLADRLLVAGANGFIGGEPKSLKSWLALYLALCLACGVSPFGKYFVKEPVRVLYLQEEDGERRVRRRVRKILAGLGMDAPRDDFFRYSVKAGLLLDDKTWLARLRTELAEYRPGIVVGDVFELMHTRDGDRRADMKPIFYALDRLREEFGCGFLLADHFKKATLGASRRGGQRLSGTVGKHAWVENSLYLFPLSGKNRVRVEPELKDAGSEPFGVVLEDTADGGVVFKWEPEGDDREVEAKAKILASLEGLAAPGEWLKTAEVARAAGMSGNTAKKYLDLLVDVDGKAEREQRKDGRVKSWHWRLRASGA